MMGAVSGRLVVAAGMFLAGLALGGWLIFLAGQGLDRADQWSSVVGAVAAVLIGLGGLVLGVLSLRESRRANQRSAPPPAAADQAGGPAVAGPLQAGPVQVNTASGGATVFAVQGGNLYLDKGTAPPAPESGR